MKFLYVRGQLNKDKMLSLGYQLLKSNAKGDLFIFKNKNKDKGEALKFGVDDELENSGIQFVPSDILTF